MHALLRLIAASVAVALTGCAAIDDYRSPKVDFDTPSPAVAAVATAPMQAAPQPSNGAIYHVAAYRPLFEDHRARLPGDSLTVNIVEKVTASQSSTSSIAKNGEISAGISALPLLAPNSFKRASASGESDTSHAGKGATQSSNDFSGTVTVIVTGVLPNGHLLVQGEKQIGVNANVDVLRFSGQVDPLTITPGNQVSSTKVANVRVEQKSRGQQADAQVMGWLSRVFLSVLPI